MPELNIGIALGCLKQPFKKALLTAARLGASGIEIDLRNSQWPKDLGDTGRRQLRKMLDDLNLRVASVRFSTLRGYDVLPDLDRRIDATKEAMRFAYNLGTRVVVNAVGYVPEESTHPAYVQLRESLTDLARYGQHVGAMLACETGSEPVEQLAGLLKSLPTEAIGIAFNPGNLIVNDCYHADSIKVCAPFTLLVVARDGVRDVARGRGLQVPLGRGSAEFSQILGVLEDVPYRGWFIIDPHDSDDPLYEIENAIKYLKAL